MKRDMDLIRNILIDLESKSWESKKLDDPEYLYHMWLLMDAGFALGNMRQREDGVFKGTLFYLTWKGHDFLDDIRDEGIWSKTKDKIKDVGGASVPIIQRVASELVIQGINLIKG